MTDVTELPKPPDSVVRAYKIADAVVERFLTDWVGIGEGRPLPVESVLPEEYLADGTRNGCIYYPRAILRMVIAQEIVKAGQAPTATEPAQ